MAINKKPFISSRVKCSSHYRVFPTFDIGPTKIEPNTRCLFISALIRFNVAFNKKHCVKSSVDVSTGIRSFRSQPIGFGGVCFRPWSRGVAFGLVHWVSGVSSQASIVMNGVEHLINWSRIKPKINLTFEGNFNCIQEKSGFRRTKFLFYIWRQSSFACAETFSSHA